jgi:hypothetical protein
MKAAAAAAAAAARQAVIPHDEGDSIGGNKLRDMIKKIRIQDVIYYAVGEVLHASNGSPKEAEESYGKAKRAHYGDAHHLSKKVE